MEAFSGGACSNVPGKRHGYGCGKAVRLILYYRLRISDFSLKAPNSFLFQKESKNQRSSNLEFFKKGSKSNVQKIHSIMAVRRCCWARCRGFDIGGLAAPGHRDRSINLRCFSPGPGGIPARRLAPSRPATGSAGSFAEPILECVLEVGPKRLTKVTKTRNAARVLPFFQFFQFFQFRSLKVWGDVKSMKLWLG